MSESWMSASLPKKEKQDIYIKKKKYFFFIKNGISPGIIILITVKWILNTIMLDSKVSNSYTVWVYSLTEDLYTYLKNNFSS